MRGPFLPPEDESPGYLATPDSPTLVAHPAFKQLGTAVSKHARLIAQSPLKAPFVGRSGDGTLLFNSIHIVRPSTSRVYCSCFYRMSPLKKGGAVSSRRLGMNPQAIWLRRINPASRQLETEAINNTGIGLWSPLKARFMGRSFIALAFMPGHRW